MGAPSGGRDPGRDKFRRGLTEGLLEFARAHFALSKVDPATGKTRLKLYLEIKEQTGVEAPELKALPPLPEETGHIWIWFEDLSSARGAGFTINAISWHDVWAYFDLKRVRPQAWEVQTLRALDDAFLQSRVETTGTAVADSKALKNRMTGKAARGAKGK